MTKIEFYDPYNDTVLGEWARSGESIIADPDTQSILDAALGRAKPDKVWEQYRSWTNGYIASREVGDETKADPRDGDGDGWIGEGTKHKRRARRAFHVSPVRLEVGDEVIPANDAGHYQFQRIYDEAGMNGNEEGRGDFIYLTDEEAAAWESPYGLPNPALAVPFDQQVRRVYEVEVDGEIGTFEDLSVPFNPEFAQNFEEYDAAMQEWLDGDMEEPPPDIELVPPPSDPHELVARRAKVVRVIEQPEPAEPFPVFRGDPVPELNAHVGQPWYGVEDWRDVRVDMAKHLRTADAYDALPEWDESAKPAYDAMISEVNDQYRLLTEELGFTVEVVDEDPYASAEELIADMTENRRIKVLSTKSTPPGHSYLTDEENDKFRAVHDAFGHAGTGRGFDRHGEEAAYEAHGNMFGPLARRALATETRGQNAVVIRSAELTGVGEFPIQKFALIPEEFTKGEPVATDDVVDADHDNLYGFSETHHVSIGRFPRDLTDFEQAAWVAQREAFRSETKADPRDGDGDGWIGEGTKHKRRASRRPSASILETYIAAEVVGPELPQGIQADVSIKVGPLGSVVVKDFGYGEAEAWWAEQKAAEFGEMLGVDMPRSFAPDDEKIVMDLVTTEDGDIAPTLAEWKEEEVERRIGTLGQRFDSDPDWRDWGHRDNGVMRERIVSAYQADKDEAAGQILDQILHSPEGGRIALFDYLTANVDRHDSNILIRDGKPVAIDHGLALNGESYGPDRRYIDGQWQILGEWNDDPSGLFTEAWITAETAHEPGSHKFSQEDLDAASEAIDYMDADPLPLERKVREGMRHRLLALQRMMDDAA